MFHDPCIGDRRWDRTRFDDDLAFVAAGQHNGFVPSPQLRQILDGDPQFISHQDQNNPFPRRPDGTAYDVVSLKHLHPTQFTHNPSRGGRLLGSKINWDRGIGSSQPHGSPAGAASGAAVGSGVNGSTSGGRRARVAAVPSQTSVTHMLSRLTQVIRESLQSAAHGGAEGPSSGSGDEGTGICYAIVQLIKGILLCPGDEATGAFMRAVQALMERLMRGELGSLALLPERVRNLRLLLDRGCIAPGSLLELLEIVIVQLGCNSVVPTELGECG